MRSALALLALAAACGADARPTAGRDSTTSTPTSTDSLAVRIPQGIEVWFGDGRDAADSAGHACRERSLQIRRDGKTLAVPLLYTGETPSVADDSTLHVHLWRNCRPGDLYAASLRTGQPTRIGAAGAAR